MPQHPGGDAGADHALVEGNAGRSIYAGGSDQADTLLLELRVNILTMPHVQIRTNEDIPY
jgi:hypothetical protein